MNERRVAPHPMKSRSSRGGTLEDSMKEKEIPIAYIVTDTNYVGRVWEPLTGARTYLFSLGLTVPEGFHQ